MTRACLLAASFCLVLAPLAPAQTTATESVLFYSSSAGPSGNIIQASDGNIYGVSKDRNSIVRYTPVAAGFVASPSVATIHTETGTNGDTGTYSSVIEGTDGNFYGTSSNGGVNSYGSIFKVTSAGVFTTLYSFCSQSLCADGQYPQPLVQGTDGNFYGTASNGGNQSSNGSSGTIFRISPAGAFSLLYSFCAAGGACVGGSEPSSGLVQANDGNFYGITTSGGAHTITIGGASFGAGVLYQLSPSDKEKVVYNFCSQGSCADGAFPTGQLVAATDSLFGLVSYVPEGTTSSEQAMFSVSISDSAFGDYQQPLLYCNIGTSCGSDPDNYGNPQTPFFTAGEGDLFVAYGYGGVNEGLGTASGALASLDGTYSYSFCALPNCADGSEPSGAAIQANDGSFYGTLSGNGTDPGMYRVVFTNGSTPLRAPIVLTSSATNLLVGQTAQLSWSVNNADSDTVKQCTGWLNGTLFGNVPLSGSTSYKPSAPGTYLASITCGGVETGLVRLVATSSLVGTVTALTAPSSALADGSITLSGSVLKQGSTPGVPVGTVTIKANGTAVATVPVQPDGTYSFSASGAAVVAGTYSLVATYNGDSGDTASSSAPTPLTIARQSTRMGVGAFPNPVPAGQQVRLACTVYGTVDDPTGTVTFSYNGTSIATVGVTASTGETSTAQYIASTSGLPAGTYAVKASYSGDSINAPTTGSVSVTVQ